MSDRRFIERLQFRLNMERRRSRNPMAACIRLYEMMMDNLHSNFQPAIESLEKKRVIPHALSGLKDGGEIIPFQKRSGKAKSKNRDRHDKWSHGTDRIK